MHDQKSCNIADTWNKLLSLKSGIARGLSVPCGRTASGRAADSDGDFLSGRHLSCRPISSPDKVEELN